MLPLNSKPRRRVSSLQPDETHTAFTIGDSNQTNDLRKRSTHGIWSRPGLILSIFISLMISIILCIIDIFLLEDPLALLQIRLFAWFGLPSLIILCITMAVVLVRTYAATISLLFGRESLLSNQTRQNERLLIASVFLVLAELVICRFWLSGCLELIFMNEPERIWSQAFEITSLRLTLAIELCEVLYLLIFFWVLLSISVQSVKKMVMSDALVNDIAEIRLNRKILSTVCCESERQRDRLLQKWQSQSEVDAKDEIDYVRENPLRLPLTASVNMNRVQKWIYSETESVDVTSLSQMHVLSKKIRENLFSASGTLTYRQWEMLFNDEDVANQAWFLMFTSLNLADNTHVSEHQFALALVNAYMRHTLLQGKIRNYDSIFHILKMMAAVAWCFAMVYIISLVLGDNPTFMLVSLIAFFGSVTFAVSSSINYAVISVIFILFKKPYQIGDRISIDGADYFVEQINLLSTTFTSTDNQCLIMSNYSLSAMKIYNHQLSSPAVVVWVATLHPDITDDQLEQLRLGLGRYARQHAEFWKPQIAFILNHLTDNSLKVTVKAHHRLNWQLATNIAEHQTAMIEEFRQLHLSMGIDTSSPERSYHVPLAAAA